MRHEVVKGDERQLTLEMRILAQMAARVAVLRAEALLHAEHVAQTG